MKFTPQLKNGRAEPSDELTAVRCFGVSDLGGEAISLCCFFTDLGTMTFASVVASTLSA